MFGSLIGHHVAGLRLDQRMIVGDLLDQATLNQAIDGCEVVYNFAAIADLDEALEIR